jgi:hypothetical protein
MLNRAYPYFHRKVCQRKAHGCLLHKSVKNQGMNLVLSVSICVHLWFLI